jgi:2-polyprenyl-6-methoxyphenol hydroxylase-like FAD-dependent oxidoreductase
VERHVAVVGAGISGLGAALAFARHGHRVTLLEADGAEPPASPQDAFEHWARSGVGQFRSTHGFVALGHKVLQKGAPDVLGAVFAAGARPVDFTRLFPPGDVADGDSELVGIACRRAVLEHVLHAAVTREPGVEIRAGSRARGLLHSSAAAGRQVTGVLTHEGPDVSADLVVDAAGRLSPIPAWWAELAVANPVEERDDCGIVYYGRYFQARPGAAHPDGRWFFGPLGDLGYLGYVIHIADNGVFTITFNAPTWDREFRVLRDVEPFMAAVAQIPALSAWIQPEAVEPISDVFAMGGLSNIVRSFETPPVGGLAILGDSRCHTNPALGWGASVGLDQAFRLAALVDEVGETDASLTAAFEAVEGPRCRSLYSAVAGSDRLRTANWRGLTPPPDPATAAALELKTLFQPAAPRDPAVLRAILRRNNLLSDPFAIFADPDLRSRAETVAARDPGLAPPQRASRAQFLAALTA